MRKGGSFLNLSGCVLFLSALLSGAASGAGQSPWSPVGPPGGPLDAVVVDPVNPRVIYAGAEQGGVYKSVDGGQSWNLASAGLADPTVNVLAIDPSNPSIVYAGTNGGLPPGGRGFWKSTDGALHWTPSNAGLPSSRAVRGIAIDPSNPARLLIALAAQGIYESLDHGASWTNRSTGLTSLLMESVAIDPRDPAIAWAGSYGIVFRTGNAGANWTEADAGLPKVTSMDALLPDPAQSGRVFAGTAQGIFVTTDGGAHWAASSAGMPTLPEIFAIARAADGALYATDYNSGVYRSTDSGAHWVPMNTGLQLSYGYWALAVDPTQPSVVYLTADAFGGGLFRTTDAGAHWSLSVSGISALWVNAVAVDPRRDTTLFAGTFGSGVYRTLDGGLTWEPSDRQDLPVEALLVDPFDTSIVFAAVQRDGGIFRSHDEGATWNTSGQGTSGNFYSIIAAASGTTLYAGGDKGVFVSVDFGAHWSPSSNGLTGGPIRTIALDPADASTLYAGNLAGVFKSTNGGHSWSPSSAGLPTNNEVEVVAIDPSDHVRLYAGLAGGEVFESGDGGLHWSPRNAGLSFPGVRGMAINPAVPEQIWVSTFGAGIFRSDDGGSHWSTVSAGLATLATNAIVEDPRRRVLYVGVAGGGVEALSLVGPRGAALSANPPSPARVRPPH
jgi:photosystem II stability/assembly factor-like uncharacterized protein